MLLEQLIAVNNGESKHGTLEQRTYLQLTIGGVFTRPLSIAIAPLRSEIMAKTVVATVSILHALSLELKG